MTGTENLRKLLQDALELAKKYPNRTLLIPTILGGIYQIVGLIRVGGIQFISYFSPNQLVADGILTISFFLTIFACSVLMIFYLDKVEAWRTNLNPKKKQIDFFNIGVIILGLYMFMIVFFILMCFIRMKIPNVPIILKIILVAFISPFVSVPLIYYIDKALKKANEQRNIKTVQTDSKRDKILIAIFSILIVIVFILIIPEIINEQKKISNLDYLECSIKKEFPDRKDEKFIYQNDKYIFYRIIYTNDYEIKIFETKDLFKVKKCE